MHLGFLWPLSQEGEKLLFNLILDWLSFSSKLEEVWFWPCSQGNLEEPDFPVHWGNCYFRSRILSFSFKAFCKPFPCSLHPVEWQLSPHGTGLSPGHGRIPSGQGVECKRSWLSVLQPNHTFPPLLHQSLQLKFHCQGWSEVRQEQTCFQEGEGELNFLPEWAFFQSGLKKCPLPPS